VPYRGGAPLVQDMLGDHIDFAFGQAAGYITNVDFLDGSRRWVDKDSSRGRPPSACPVLG